MIKLVTIFPTLPIPICPRPLQHGKMQLGAVRGEAVQTDGRARAAAGQHPAVA